MARVLCLLPLLFIFGIFSVIVYQLFLKPYPPLPELDLEEWWGPPEMKKNTKDTIRDFQVNFSDEMIADLKERIKSHRTGTTPLEDIGFEYGFNSDQLQYWLDYWSNGYQFKERQKFFNQYPHYKTNIQGLDVHFIRVKPQNVPGNKEIVPLLMVHGWPGSVREFYEAIPKLTEVSDGRDFVLELIIPSIPGYGFSDAAVRPGLSSIKVAVIMRNLMQRLGFKQYYVQGGDWGAFITATMATFFPNEVLGLHSNMLSVMSPLASFWEYLGSFYPSLFVENNVVDRVYPLSRKFSFLLEETGYMHIQATKPDTVGVALSDSPPGLLAYILEKFSTWTHPEYRKLKDGGLELKFNKDKLLDNLMVYWSTNSITTSMRLYSETFNKQFLDEIKLIRTSVPTWALQAKYELQYQPPSVLKSKYPNLLGATVTDDGGHFLAFELPEVFASDVLKAIGEFRNWNRNNKVKNEL